MTSTTGTTYTEEIPIATFFNATMRKRVPSLSGIENKSNSPFGYLSIDKHIYKFVKTLS
ncbi:hypothetical protein ACN077_08155 [Clostridium chromiireducens]|uniref:Uncharacterized protein n=1 Tax=Clostridium chromiireducens TaxID=225345 RepID=A0A964RLR1_9CLOT|nr:hypothetical protein [Clostridium chromiireducens]MVX64124.1 hypothetical protein [Clostridium chromiireducens]